MNQSYTYLALGDSYTIGESLPLWHNFPYQIVKQLRLQNIHVSAPEIIAKTAYTTNELQEAISSWVFQQNGYDFVTLLIGVNNQYRAWPIDTYAKEFKELLEFAITQARNQPQNVIVLSIPDWGVTKFAQSKDIKGPLQAIDQFNQVNKQITQQMGAQYLYITDETRKPDDETIFAPDGLHYSQKQHAIWAQKVIELIKL